MHLCFRGQQPKVHRLGRSRVESLVSLRIREFPKSGWKRRNSVWDAAYITLLLHIYTRYITVSNSRVSVSGISLSRKD
jgi:hypothetical protein